MIETLGIIVLACMILIMGPTILVYLLYAVMLVVGVIATAIGLVVIGVVKIYDALIGNKISAKRMAKLEMKRRVARSKAFRMSRGGK